VAAAADPGPLRLEDAVQLTLSRNERARIADLNVTVSEAAVARARAAFLPVLSVNGNDSQRLEKTERPGGGSSPTNTATATASITQPLLNASAFPLYAQAKNNLGSTRAQTIDDKRQLAFSAAYAFFNVLTAEAVLRAAEQRLDSAKANLADTKARVDAQLASSNDATRAEVDLSSAARQVAQGKGDLQTTVIQLAFLMNAPITGSTFVPPDPLLNTAQQPLAPAESLVRFALQHRPDVDARKLAAAAAHNSADEPLLRLIPSIGLSGQAQGTTNSGTTGRWHDEVVSVTATWTIFDAGVRYADKRSRDATAEIADLNVKQLLRSVDTDVRTAMASLTSAQAAYQTADLAAQAARKSAEETAILYRQGLAKAIELVDANDQRFQSEVALVSAQYSMAAAYLDLRRALGLSPLGTELK
jgi:outer membrane protein TolC